MKFIFRLLLPVFIFLIGFSSCTVEKRLHRPGYHVEWHFKRAHQDITVNENSPLADKDVSDHIPNDTIVSGPQVAMDVDHRVGSSDNDQDPIPGETISSASAQEVRISNQNAAAYPVLSAAMDEPIKETKSDAVNATKKKEKKHIAAGGGKSQVVALLLCIFFGLIGVHRFYLGYPGIGVLQILTLGGLGIWTLIDLIRIATGDLQPKNGSYDDTF